MTGCPYGLHYHEGPVTSVVEGIEACRDRYFAEYGQLLPSNTKIRRMTREDIKMLVLVSEHG